MKKPKRKLTAEQQWEEGRGGATNMEADEYQTRQDALNCVRESAEAEAEQRGMIKGLKMAERILKHATYRVGPGEWKHSEYCIACRIRARRRKLEGGR